MSIGLTANKGDADQRAATIALDLRGVFDRVRTFKAWLDTVTVLQLEGLGYTTNEANQLKSAFTDLDQLRTVYEGTGTRTPAYDYRTFAKLLTGVI